MSRVLCGECEGAREAESSGQKNRGRRALQRPGLAALSRVCGASRPPCDLWRAERGEGASLRAPRKTARSLRGNGATGFWFFRGDDQPRRGGRTAGFSPTYSDGVRPGCFRSGRFDSLRRAPRASNRPCLRLGLVAPGVGMPRPLHCVCLRACYCEVFSAGRPGAGLDTGVRIFAGGSPAEGRWLEQRWVSPLALEPLAVSFLFFRFVWRFMFHASPDSSGADRVLRHALAFVAPLGLAFGVRGVVLAHRLLSWSRIMAISRMVSWRSVGLR